MAEHGVQGVAVAFRRGGERADVGVAGRNVFGDAQGGRYPQAPRRGQVQHLLQIHPAARVRSSAREASSFRFTIVS